MSYYCYRDSGEETFSPHNGNGMMRLPGDHHTYHCFPGHAHSGLTRAIWEFTPIEKGNGGTKFISGSHKATFALPKSAQKNSDSSLWETYTCPAGSLLLFKEATTHSATQWKNTMWPRIMMLNSYNTIGSKWHKWDPDPKLVAAMSPKRRSLFRPVQVSQNRAKKTNPRPYLCLR